MDKEYGKFFEPVGTVDLNMEAVDGDAIKELIYDSAVTTPFSTMEFRYRPYMPESMYVMLDAGAKMPVRSTGGSAGYDLSAANRTSVMPWRTEPVDTGVHVAIPEGWVGLVFERSSLHKRGLSLANKVGVIDSDYRGPIVLMMRNSTEQERVIDMGERVAQLVIVPFVSPDLIEVGSLDETERSEGGFGSTGRY